MTNDSEKVVTEIEAVEISGEEGNAGKVGAASGVIKDKYTIRKYSKSISS